MHFCCSLCLFSENKLLFCVCRFCLMPWKVLVDSFQADSDFLFSPLFENRKFWATDFKKEKDSGSHEEV